MPVNTIAMPCWSAAAITSASRILPPGWITAVTPTSAAWSPLLDHAAGLAGVFSGDDLRAIESGNAIRMFPKYRT